MKCKDNALGTGVNNQYARAHQGHGMRCWVNADVVYKEPDAIDNAFIASLPSSHIFLRNL